MADASPFPLSAADGRSLAAWIHEPANARGSVVILGAYATPARYYRRFAEWLSEHGYRVLRFDYRGIGESQAGPIQREQATTTDWALLDARAALDWLARQPGPKLGVGHSFGGQLIGILDQMQILDRLYTMGSQLGWHGYYDGLARYRMWGMFKVVMPLATRAFGYLPGWTGIGEDVPSPAMLEWLKWLSSPRYLLDFVPDAEARFKRYRTPTRVLGLTDDSLAPPRGIEALWRCLDPEIAELSIVKPQHFGMQKVDHFGFFRPHPGLTMWEDCLAWLEG